MKVNQKLLPVKGHFFFFNAGTAPLVPYLSTYARQLGFSSATVGLIYTVLPIFGLIAKPLFGVIADRFKIQKSLFIVFQIITIVSFSLIYFIPETEQNVAVELDCRDGVTVLRSCYSDANLVETCKVEALGHEGPSRCEMNCEMSSPEMWQTVCEHWHIPQYCYRATDSIEFKTNISHVTSKDSCTYISTENVTLDGYVFKPHCNVGPGYLDVNEPCVLKCANPTVAAALGNISPNMTCLNDKTNFRICSEDQAAFANITDAQLFSECEVSCKLDTKTPWRLMEICDGWGADVTPTCKPRNILGQELPANLSFVASVLTNSSLQEHDCVYVQMKKVLLDDVLEHYPYCPAQPQYENVSSLFKTSCNITCDNELLSEMLHGAYESTSEDSTQYTHQFWMFFLMMIVSWVGQAVVVSVADAICFNLLGDKPSNYGKQRLWGSVGFGIFSLLTGSLIDVFSGDGAKKDYTVAFVIMFIFLMGDVVDSCFIRNEHTRMSHNILTDVGVLLTSLPTVLFFLWTIAVGLCTGLLWQFLFWHLEDISNLNCNASAYIKTLQGLVSATQTFFGEIPFMFLSGYLLNKLGHINMMSLVLLGFGVRFLLYSFLTNPWLVLPIEMLQGLTFGMFYPTMTSYANVVSPAGTETTVQGLTGAIFEGVGTSLGSFIGGIMYESYGGWDTFRWFGVFSLCACILHAVGHHLLRDRLKLDAMHQGYSSVIRYEQPDDSVFIMDYEAADN